MNPFCLMTLDSYVALTVVRSPGGKGAVRLQWTIDEMAKDDLSPLSGTFILMRYSRCQDACSFSFNLSLMFFSIVLLINSVDINSIHYVWNFLKSYAPWENYTHTHP